MRIPIFKSIRTHLLLLVLLSVLPALGIVIYMGMNWLHSDVKAAHNDALRVLQSLANDHSAPWKIPGSSSRRSPNYLTCGIRMLPHATGSSATILKENPMYTTILAVNAKGMVFANALPFTPYSVRQRKHFEDGLRTKDFSVGSIWSVSLQASGYLPLPIRFWIREAGSRLWLLPASPSIATVRCLQGQNCLKAQCSQYLITRMYVSTGRLIRNGIWGRQDSPDMIEHMSSKPDEGLFISFGADRVRRLYAYKRFYWREVHRHISSCVSAYPKGRRSPTPEIPCSSRDASMRRFHYRHYSSVVPR